MFRHRVIHCSWRRVNRKMSVPGGKSRHGPLDTSSSLAAVLAKRGREQNPRKTSILKTQIGHSAYLILTIKIEKYGLSSV